MADDSLSPLDAYQPTAADVEPAPTANTQAGERSVAQWSGAANTASNQKPTASPLDIALSLVFKEIAEQARLATTATGAAIGLAYGSRIVCRATTGATAPDVMTAYLCGAPAPTAVVATTATTATDTVLGPAVAAHPEATVAAVDVSEPAVATGRVQVSEDVESDSRIDAATCRRFGVRSVLMVPIQQQEERLGVMAIFSPRVNAFCDRDVVTLQAFSRRVAANIELAKHSLALPSGGVTSATGATRASSKSPKFRVNLLPKVRTAGWLRSWNSFLMVLVIGLSLTVGWMLGRSSRKPIRAASHASAAVAPSTPEVQKDAAALVPTEQPAPAAVAPPTSESPIKASELPKLPSRR